VKPPVGSSGGPPGACITPSRLTKAAATIFRIEGSRGVVIDVLMSRRLHHHKRIAMLPAVMTGKILGMQMTKARSRAVSK
jgi:hypothetical protein